MSYVDDFCVRHVYVDSGSGWGGNYTPEDLRVLAGGVAKDMPDRKMVEALNFVADNPEPSAVDAMKDLGRVLLSVVSDGETNPTFGVLFAEGDQKDANGAFGVVRASLWVPRTVRYSSVGERYAPSYVRDDARELLLQLGLYDHKKRGNEDPPGIPVTRLSEINVQTQEGDPPIDSYRFGHREDLTALGGLAGIVPGGLWSELIDTVLGYHQREIWSADLRGGGGSH